MIKVNWNWSSSATIAWAQKMKRAGSLRIEVVDKMWPEFHFLAGCSSLLANHVIMLGLIAFLNLENIVSMLLMCVVDQKTIPAILNNLVNYRKKGVRECACVHACIHIMHACIGNLVSFSFFCRFRVVQLSGQFILRIFLFILCINILFILCCG